MILRLLLQPQPHTQPQQQQQLQLQLLAWQSHRYRHRHSNSFMLLPLLPAWSSPLAESRPPPLSLFYIRDRKSMTPLCLLGSICSAYWQAITDKGIVVKDRVTEKPLAVLTENSWEDYDANSEYIETGPDCFSLTHALLLPSSLELARSRAHSLTLPHYLPLSR